MTNIMQGKIKKQREYTMIPCAGVFFLHAWVTYVCVSVDELWESTVEETHNLQSNTSS